MDIAKISDNNTHGKYCVKEVNTLYQKVLWIQ